MRKAIKQDCPTCGPQGPFRSPCHSHYPQPLPTSAAFFISVPHRSNFSFGEREAGTAPQRDQKDSPHSLLPLPPSDWTCQVTSAAQNITTNYFCICAVGGGGDARVMWPTRVSDAGLPCCKALSSKAVLHWIKKKLRCIMELKVMCSLDVFKRSWDQFLAFPLKRISGSTARTDFCLRP